MNILALGNGFFLAHGFKTSYRNFLDYVHDLEFFFNDKIEKHNHTPSINEFKDQENFNLLREDMNNYSREKAIIDEQIGLLRNNGWMKYFLQELTINDGWVDFESEISLVVQIIDSIHRNIIEKNEGIINNKVGIIRG